MKIGIVTGGSGGHIFPALTYADYIKDENTVFFIGNDHKMESWIVPEAGYEFYSIHNQGLQGSKLDKIKAVLGQFKAINAAKNILKKQKPDIVMAFGGYVSLPVVMAADKLNIPIILHEQNALPGKANKMMANKATAIITCYDEAFAQRKKVYNLGNPRASLNKDTDLNETILEDMQLDINKPIVLAIMGSQGSTSMNEKFKDLIKNFDDTNIQLILTVGPTNYESFISEISDLPSNIYVKDFVDAKSLMPYISLLIARSGASTIAEVEAFGVPTLFIPSPHVANNHQYYNAMSLYEKEACAVLEEKDISDDILAAKIKELISNSDYLEKISKNAKSLARVNALPDIHELVMKVVNENAS